MANAAQPPPLTDEQQESALLERAIDGDREALEQLLMQRHDQLLRHVELKMSKRLQSKVAPEDILQQTYMQAFKAIGRFQPGGPGSFFAWLKTIATNKLIDASRQRQREPVASVRALLGSGSGASSGHLSLFGVIAGSGPAPGNEAMVEELLGAFHVALANLADNHRQVVQLRYLEDLSLEEVAGRLEITTGAARGLCHRARQALRDEIMRLSRFI